MTPMIKTFPELSCRELYEILRLRSQVFIVEQQGLYQDLDRIDYHSIHIFLPDPDGSVSGCVRIFPKPGEPGTVQVGRLVTGPRRQGLGRLLMDTAHQVARERYGAKRLFLDGRRSARAFYEACGYTASLPPDYQTEEEAPYFEFRRSL